jgi:hypothetical protein
MRVLGLYNDLQLCFEGLKASFGHPFDDRAYLYHDIQPMLIQSG